MHQPPPQTEQLLQALIENSFDLVGLLDENLNYLYISESVNQIFDNKADDLLGYSGNQLLGKNSMELIHPEDQPRVVEQLGLLFKGTKKVQLRPYRIRDVKGTWHWLEAIVTNQLGNPAIKAIIVSARDVSQQVRTEARLKEMQVLEALMEGEEKERGRIAKDLHDGISGMIAAAKMHLAALSAKASGITSYNEYQQAVALLETAASQVRQTSHNLMPEILLENGLELALQRYCFNVSNDTLRIDFISIGNSRRHTGMFELTLYRIAQELINNILRHAEATEAFVQLSQQPSLLSLSVEDNGKGFSPGLQTNGVGLRSIQKRIAAMGGSMEIRTELGSGTQIYLEFEQSTE